VIGVDESERSCRLCQAPITTGEAWMRSEREGAEHVAHSGCVYATTDVDERAWWAPPEAGQSD
jgi:hypothetical protein